MTETTRKAADIVGVLDCSGSMDTMGSEPPQAWNNFICDQQKVGGDESHASFYTFNENVTTVYTNVLLKDVQEYKNYVANGCTALYDAIRLAVKNQLATGRDKNVVFVIITDGLDNSSDGPTDKEFRTSKQEVAHLLAKMEKENNWQVVYLAADQDAFSVGSGYGAKAQKCANFGKCRGGLLTAMRQLSATASAYRATSRHVDVPDEIDLTK
uniref:VWFA domain-containing protein n=1 Tax=viral metagenome TaxID=1070528 RepID=A0A6C0EK52_9ZZZZ